MSETATKSDFSEKAAIVQRAKNAAFIFLLASAIISMVASRFYAASSFWETVLAAEEGGASVWHLLTVPRDRFAIVWFYLMRFIIPGILLAAAYVFHPFSSSNSKRTGKSVLYPVLGVALICLVTFGFISQIRHLSSEKQELAAEIVSLNKKIERLDNEKQELLHDAAREAHSYEQELEAERTAHSYTRSKLEELGDAETTIQILKQQVAQLRIRAADSERQADNLSDLLQAEQARVQVEQARVQAEQAKVNAHSQSWGRLSLGMTEEQVKALLGHPDKMFTNGKSRKYYYGYPIGGEVSFAHGEVDGWTKPPAR